MDAKTLQYQRPEFLSSDPIQIPHRFHEKSDIEIAAFLTATIAWGNRLSIIRSANRMMELLEQAPHDFVMSASEEELEPLQGFVHRTFNGLDFITFVKGLRHIYSNYGGMESLFAKYAHGRTCRRPLQKYAATFLKSRIYNAPRNTFQTPPKDLLPSVSICFYAGWSALRIQVSTSVCGRSSNPRNCLALSTYTPER